MLQTRTNRDTSRVKGPDSPSAGPPREIIIVQTYVPRSKPSIK
jgi:hypothetical protein